MIRAARAKRWLASLAAPLMLAGCNLAPSYRPPVLPVPPNYKSIPGWVAASPADTAPHGAWWMVFADPMLNGLEERLNAANPDLESAVARHDEALAYAAQARGALLPSLDLQGNAIQNRQSAQRPLRGANLPDTYTSDQANGVAGYEVDLWGKLHNDMRSRTALAQASDADRAAVQISLQAELATDYLRLRGLDEDIALLDRTVADYQRGYALTQTLFRGKIAAQMDVSRASVQLNNAMTAAAQARADRALMENAIAVLVGDMPSTFTLAPVLAALSPPSIPQGIPSGLLQRRPDIASAERTLAAASLQIGVARAALYPSLTFDAVGGVMSEGTNPFRVADLFWALGPSVNLPLFNGGKLKAQVAQAQARFHEASARYRATTLAAFQDVEDNRALLAQLANEARSSEAAAAAAQQTTTAALRLYADGATSYLDVVTAETALLEAQRAVVSTRTQRLTASVSLIRALGGGWSAEQPSPATQTGDQARPAPSVITALAPRR